MEGEPRPVTVHRAELLSHEGDRVEFEIECSAGTYVRALVADLGDAYCEELRRTAVGPFDLARADPETLVPIGDALAFLPERPLEAAEADRVAHGVRVPGVEGLEGPVRLTHEGRLVALAERRGPDLQPVVVFAG